MTKVCGCGSHVDEQQLFLELEKVLDEYKGKEGGLPRLFCKESARLSTNPTAKWPGSSVFIHSFRHNPGANM